MCALWVKGTIIRGNTLYLCLVILLRATRFTLFCFIGIFLSGPVPEVPVWSNVHCLHSPVSATGLTLLDKAISLDLPSEKVFFVEGLSVKPEPRGVAYGGSTPRVLEISASVHIFFYKQPHFRVEPLIAMKIPKMRLKVFLESRLKVVKLFALSC